MQNLRNLQNMSNLQGGGGIRLLFSPTSLTQTKAWWNTLSSTHIQSAIGDYHGTQYEKSVYDFDGSSGKVTFSDIGEDKLVDEIEFYAYMSSDVTSASSLAQVMTTYHATINYSGLAFGASTGSLTGETLTLLPDGGAREAMTNTIPSGWHKYRIVWDGSKHDFYIDDVLQTRISTGTPSQLNARSLILGTRANNTQWWAGKMSNIKVTSGSTVYSVYCEERTGTVAFDVSGNGYVGTLAGSVTHTTARDTLLFNHTNEEGYSLGVNYFPHSEDPTEWKALGAGNPAYSGGTWSWDGGGAGNVYFPTDQVVNARLFVGDTTGRTITMSMMARHVSGENSNFVLGLRTADNAEVSEVSVSLTSTLSKIEHTYTYTGNASGEILAYIRYTGTTTTEIEVTEPQVEEAATSTDYQPTYGQPISGVIVPIDASNPTLDIFGNTPTRLGQVAPDLKLVNSNCGESSGANTLLVPGLSALETATNEGTATVAVTAGTLTFGAGTIYDVQVSSGEHYTFSEGAGTVAYDMGGDENHGTFDGTWGSQDSYHYNITGGYSRYTHATLDDILVPYGDSGSPMVITPPSGYTKDSDNPSTDVYNGAETQATMPVFRENLATVDTLYNQSTYVSNDVDMSALTSNENDEFFSKIAGDNITEMIATSPALSGDDLSDMEDYVSG